VAAVATRGAGAARVDEDAGAEKAQCRQLVRSRQQVPHQRIQQPDDEASVASAAAGEASATGSEADSAAGITTGSAAGSAADSATGAPLSASMVAGSASTCVMFVAWCRCTSLPQWYAFVSSNAIDYCTGRNPSTHR
jgi:hypothetical protein